MEITKAHVNMAYVCLHRKGDSVVTCARAGDVLFLREIFTASAQ